MSQTPKQREANRTRWRAEADLPPDDESMLRLSAPIDRDGSFHGVAWTGDDRKRLIQEARDRAMNEHFHPIGIGGRIYEFNVWRRHLPNLAATLRAIADAIDAEQARRDHLAKGGGDA